jgi:hypothetical protein
VGQLKLIPNAWPDPGQAQPLAQFSDQIALLAYRIEGCETGRLACQISLTWLAQGQPSADYTVFIQLWPQRPSQAGPTFYGFDAPPLTNDYPTSLWAPNEVIIDPHHLALGELPAGLYQIRLGLYEPASGERLAAFQGDQPLPDNRLILDTLELSP